MYVCFQFCSLENDIFSADFYFTTPEDWNCHEIRVHTIKLNHKTKWLFPSDFELKTPSELKGANLT